MLIARAIKKLGALWKRVHPYITAASLIGILGLGLDCWYSERELKLKAGWRTPWGAFNVHIVRRDNNLYSTH